MSWIKESILVSLVLLYCTIFFELVTVVMLRVDIIGWWSDRAGGRITVPVMRSSSQRLIRRSRVWPWMWVGNLTCCSKWRLYRRDLNFSPLGSNSLSTWILKSSTTRSLPCSAVYQAIHIGKELVNEIGYRVWRRAIQYDESQLYICKFLQQFHRFKWVKIPFLLCSFDGITQHDCNTTALSFSPWSVK